MARAKAVHAGCNPSTSRVPSATLKANFAGLLSEVDEGKYVAGRETLDEFLDLWLERIQARVMTESGANDDREQAPNTYFTYERHCRVQIRPVLGTKLLAKLTALDVERAIDAWRAMPSGKNPDRKLSGRTVFNVFKTLEAALNKAVAWKRLRSNPCRDVEPPEKR